MNIFKGEIKASISDARLQELAMEVLLPQAPLPEELKALIKPALIQGIIDAEAADWEWNDDFPSIPNAWGRALFAMSLPVKGIAEMDDAGWYAAGGAGLGAGLGAGIGTVAAKFGIGITLGSLAGWLALAGAGLGIVLVEGAYGVLGAIGNPKNPTRDINSSVGRGQISQGAWDQAVAAYGAYFPQYLDKVMQEIKLKTRMQLAMSSYKLNDISVKYNPMGKQNVKVLENFMIAAALLKKCHRAGDRISEGRSAEDALKYGIAAYHGVDMNAVNKALGREGALGFPSEAEFASLKRKDDYNYVMEVVK